MSVANMDNPETYVVGIGTSAGGLEALERFFKGMPVTDRLVFLVIQHLSPDYKSHMVELLSKYTELPVHAAADGVAIQPGNIYLLPPRNNMTIFNGKLYLVEYDRSQGLNLPIDILFESLAKDQGNRAIGCILSGTGSDGTRGIRAIKENGGFVIAQNDSARFDGMPRSAIATQLVDYVSTPEDMAGIILRFIEHPNLIPADGVESARMPEHDLIGKVLAILRDRNNMDFTGYKQNTLIRRIERRMSLLDIQSLDGYSQHLQKSEVERKVLCKEFLIGVTRFFRDTEAFEFLQTDIIPALVNSKERKEQIRVWVPGCSTGEEAYSLAILFRDYMERTGRFVDVKIFATDIDRDALERAGQGRFAESVTADIPRDLLSSYFVKQGENYEILRQIRSMVVFAYQNIITDPPFSRIDLVTCRNLLIYLQPELQRHILSIFQFALKTGGFLLLGSSESLGEKAPEFAVENSKCKVYRYRGGHELLKNTRFESRRKRATSESSFREVPAIIKPVDDWRSSEPILRSLVENILPPCVVVDEKWNMVHSFGEIDDYLHAPRGYQVNLNIMKLLREDISIPLSTGLHRTFKDGSDVTYRHIQVAVGNDETRLIDLTTRLFLVKGSTQYALILFIKHDADDQTVVRSDVEIEDFKLSDGVSQRISNLEQELQYTRENLQATIEELETSNEELQAANEELMAANEELQSTNEELESVNEELLTVNNEYQVKIRELTALNDDMTNLLNSIEFGVVFLDSELRVRKFTPAAQKAINLMQQDTGRPIHHFAHNLVNFELTEAITDVIERLVPAEYTVLSTDDVYYLLRINPYRTHNNQINGVVLTLANITDMQDAMTHAEQANTFAQSILNSLTAQIAVLDEEGVIIQVNDAWRDFARENDGSPDTTDVGVNYLEICRHSTGIDSREAPASYEGLRAVIDGEIDEFDLEYPCHSPTEERWFMMRAVPLLGGTKGVVVSHMNVTAAKHIESALRLSEKRYQLAAVATQVALFEQDESLTYTWLHNPDTPFPTEDMLGLTDSDVLPEAEAEALMAAKQQVLHEGKTHQQDVRLTLDGQTYICKMHLDPITNVEGHITGFVGSYSHFDLENAK